MKRQLHYPATATEDPKFATDMESAASVKAISPDVDVRGANTATRRLLESVYQEVRGEEFRREYHNLSLSFTSFPSHLHSSSLLIPRRTPTLTTPTPTFSPPLPRYPSITLYM